MSLFALRRQTQPASSIEEAAPVPRGLLIWMLVIMGVLGFLSQTDRQIPSFVIALCSITGMVGLLMVSMRRPEMPLYVMVAYLPFSKILVGDFGGIMTALNLTNLFIILLFVNWMNQAATEGRKPFEGHILHVPILLMTLWVILSFLRIGVLFGNDWAQTYFQDTIGDLKRWLDPIIIYFVFFHLVRDRQRWKTVVVIIMLGVTIAAIMAIREYLTGSEGSSLESSRVGGIAGQPNILGAFFVYYMFLFAAFWLDRLKQPKAWGQWVPFLLCFRGIMVTFSRGAYLAFAQGVLGLTYFKNKFLFTAVTIGIVLTLLNPWVLPAGIRFRLESTFKPETQFTDPYASGGNIEKNLDESSAQRLLIWRGARAMINKNPWFGCGLGLFPYTIGRYLETDRWVDAHNAYIITAAEFGIPALVFFIIILLLLYRVTVAVYRRHPDPFIRTTALGFLGGLSGLFMANMFGSRLNTTEVSGYFWILAALMARAHLWVRASQAGPRDAASAGAATARRGARSPNAHRSARRRSA